jgi:hypothetical protein
MNHLVVSSHEVHIIVLILDARDSGVSRKPTVHHLRTYGIFIRLPTVLHTNGRYLETTDKKMDTYDQRRD